MKITKNRRAICKDGFSLSVQADSMTYCSPRVNDADEYTAVEVGFPSWDEPLLAPYQDGEGDMRERQAAGCCNTAVRRVARDLTDLNIAETLGIGHGSATST